MAILVLWLYLSFIHSSHFLAVRTLINLGNIQKHLIPIISLNIIISIIIEYILLLLINHYILNTKTTLKNII